MFLLPGLGFALLRNTKERLVLLLIGFRCELGKDYGEFGLYFCLATCQDVSTARSEESPRLSCKCLSWVINRVIFFCGKRLAENSSRYRGLLHSRRKGMQQFQF